MTAVACHICEVKLLRDGFVERCDHPFPGRPLAAYVANEYDPASGAKPYRLRMVWAQTLPEARQALGEKAKECSSPDLLALMADHGPLEIVETRRDVPATRYDRFIGVKSRAGFEAMLDEGIDVS